MNYTGYCTAFYDKESGMVYFHDEIKNRAIGKQKVSGRVEAGLAMRIWQDNAPKGSICEIIDD